MKSSKNRTIKALSLVLAILSTATFCLTGCKPKKPPVTSNTSESISGSSGSSGSTTTTYYDNLTDPLVFSSAECDKVFNPFFSTNAADSSVVGMTQIGMLTNDELGNPVYGENEAVVALDYAVTSEGTTEDVDLYTTYHFVLKNNVKFSDGKPLTIKDVLFNLYVYLDPVYTGSSTIYSTDIVGLKEYRTQESDETEQDAFNDMFEREAEDRVRALVEACEEVHERINDGQYKLSEFKKALADYCDELGGSNDEENYYANIVEDYESACKLFKEEIETDYTNSIGSNPADVKFYDKDNNEHKGLFSTEVELFLYNEGFISWSKKDAKLSSSLVTNVSDLKNWTKQQAIDKVYASMIPGRIVEVISYWATASNLFTDITNAEKEKYFADESNITYKNISGIQFANRNKTVTVNGKDYPAPTYNADGSVKSGNEVLTIKIKNVDPKAVWNFSFGIAPMHYYSNAEQIEKFDFETHFGVEMGSKTFMNDVVKSPAKIGVPLGAGPYAASKASGGINNIQAGEFYDKGVIYFERNPYFVMGEAKIKKVRYQVVSSARMLDSLYTKAIDFATPNAKVETIDELNKKKGEGIRNKSVRTMGYGYIGINAGKVPDLEVRQAIMHTINTQECVDYYRTTAAAIHRPISLESWAYPRDNKGNPSATAYYPYVGSPIPENLDVVNPAYAEFVEDKGYSAGEKMTEADQKEFITGLIENAKSNFSLNANGVYVSRNGSHTLKYTFTIAGEETDHPAWDAMYHAASILNKWGFDITVTTDANALSKLSSGDLTVWAAAWGSTIDPDMYQVYHKDSNATSVNNWGYPQIKLGRDDKYDYEWGIIEELSDYIDQGRKTNDQNKRKEIYSKALDLVMQLAVELPTYQRDDLFAYNANKIDEGSLYMTPTSFKGLTSDLHLVSLVTER